MVVDEQVFKALAKQDVSVAALWMMLWYEAHHGNAAMVWHELEAVFGGKLWYQTQMLMRLGLLVKEPDSLFVNWLPEPLTDFDIDRRADTTADVTLYRTSHIPALQSQFPITTPSAGVHFYATSMEQAIQLAMYLAPIQPKTDQTNIFPDETPAPKRKTKRKGPKNAEERVIVQAVGDYWRQRMGYLKLKVTDTRVDYILARYRAGYSIKQMKQVIDWVASDDWMRGRAAKSTRKYDDFVNFMDTNQKFEKYLHLAITQNPSSLDSTLKASDAPVRVERMQ